MKTVRPEDLPEEFGLIAGVRDPRDTRIAELETALREIARMKPEPIGGTGFCTGPQALFDACQRRARKALRKLVSKA